jgi:predicted nucleic acid-binding protein
VHKWRPYKIYQCACGAAKTIWNRQRFQFDLGNGRKNNDCGSGAGGSARYRISVADAWIAATAKVHHLNLVHKDPEFEPLKDELTLHGTAI